MMKKVSAVCVLIFACYAWGYSQVSSVQQAQSIYIYNFSRLIQWPSGNQSGEFVIGVIGNENLYKSLNAFIVNKKVGTQPIVVKNFDGPESLTRCHILFVGNSKMSAFDEVLTRVRGTNSLIITEKKGMINMGSAIDFFMDQDKLKFVINSENANKYNLTVSKSLEDMAYRN